MFCKAVADGRHSNTLRNQAGWRKRLLDFLTTASVGVACMTAQAHAAANAPYYPLNIFKDDTSVSKNISSAVTNKSSAGLVFTLPWSSIQPTCESYSFAADENSVLGYLAAHLRADQKIYPGIAGGASSPSCLQGLGIPYVTLYYAFLNNTGDPCQLYSLPLMTSSIYAQRYIEAVHAMLAALAKIPVASGGTLASRVAGVTVAAYIVLTSEMRIPGMGCSVGDVNQTAAQQAALWATAGYTSADALSIYQTIIRGIASDEALPNDAVLLQNVMGGEKESFPQPVGATPVLQPLLAASNAALGTRFVVSWNMVSEFGALPPRDVITAASAGTPLALQFNATAQGVTSCRGKLPNGHLDPIPATPACFQAMQPRNTAVIPQQSYLALWQVPPADFSVPGYFAN